MVSYILYADSLTLKIFKYHIGAISNDNILIRKAKVSYQRPNGTFFLFLLDFLIFGHCFIQSTPASSH